MTQPIIRQIQEKALEELFKTAYKATIKAAEVTSNGYHYTGRTLSKEADLRWLEFFDACDKFRGKQRV